MTKLFKHALVALDLSEASDLILECVPHLSKFGTEKVTLVSVVPIPYSGEKAEFNTDKQRKQLKSYKKQLEEKGFEVRFEIRSGVHFYPPTEIIEQAEKSSADYIVIANRGHSKVQELLMGSTATEVLQRSPLPVYLINVEVEWHDDDTEKRKLVLSRSAGESLDHILYATDFSENAARAFEVVKYFEANGYTRNVTLVHVQGHHYMALSDPATYDEVTRKNQEQLEKLRNQFTDSTREHTDIIVTFGTPAKEIIQASEERGATMIIIGSQGKGFVEKFFLGGVSNQVTRMSTIPVFLIPAERA
ncbi:universal stress protein [Rhodohalobacter mucosus]|nr:universal stress protein [Rhodohalobacter mucosus]